VMGSNVCSGSGTMPAQTTMCTAFDIFLSFVKN
jgi:hypothetical protein